MKQKRFLLLALLFAVVNIATMRGFEVPNSDGVSISYSLMSYTDMSCMVISNSTSPYSGKVVIPESVVFQGTKYTVKVIQASAFKNCTGLTEVEIPNTVSEINLGTFSGCTSLTSVKIPDSVTEISQTAFKNCSSLTSIVLPNSLTEIEHGVFANCSSLTSVKIPKSVTKIGDYAFNDCGLTSVEIPESVTSIGESAFHGCTGLTSVNIPTSVTTIGNFAFEGCNELKSVVIPNSVTTIGNFAFRNCSNLTLVEIPSSVKSIGEGAFRNCNSDIYLYGDVSGDNIFNYFNGTLHSYESKREEITSSEGWSSDYATFVPLKENISISEIGLATFSTMGGLDLTGNVDVAAYKASVDGDRVVLERVDKVAPYEGVLLRSLNGEAFSDEILSAYVDEPNEGNAFVGTVKETTVEATNGGTTNYVLGSKDGNVGFYRANSTTVGAGKAYLPVPNGAANVKGFRIEFSDDDATGIVEMLGDGEMSGEDYYDLSGRRADNLKSGVYVKNGKKVYIIKK